MYDNHIFCKEYKSLKNTIVDILNGDDYSTDVEQLGNYIQELYDNGEMTSSQYDDLMSYVQDILDMS